MLRRRIRKAALIAIIGLVRLARVVRARPGLAFLLAGAVLSVAAAMLPSGAVFIAGMLVFLRGAAVLLGVSEPCRPGGRQAGRATSSASGPRRRAGVIRQGYQALARCSVSSARNCSGWSRCGPWPASSMTASRYRPPATA